jgi:hypothetical protein
MPVLKGNVVWLDFENGKRRTHDRFSVLGITLQLPVDAAFYYYSMPTPILNSRDKEQIEELVKLIHKHESKLVTIDNLGNISVGADENSTEMVEIFMHLRWLVEETGAVIIVIRHRRKSAPKNGRMGDGLRGLSSIEAALDLSLLVIRENDSNTINKKPTKVRGSDVQSFATAFKHLHDNYGELNHTCVGLEQLFLRTCSGVPGSDHRPALFRIEWTRIIG